MPLTDNNNSSPLLISIQNEAKVNAPPSIVEHCSTSADPFGSRTSIDQRAIKKLLIAIILCFIFMVAELVGGYISRSLAIMTDAAHLLSDVAGFLISLCAIGWSRKRASSSMSYGYHRAEILGALLSIAMVWALTFFLVMEAIDRLRNPQPIDGKVMFITAIFGVLVNAVIGLVLHEHHHHHHHHRDINNPLEQDCHDQLHETLHLDPSTDVSEGRHQHNLNVQAAFVHAIGDLIQSVGVFIAASIIWWKPEWHIADPLCTFLFSILVISTTWFLARDIIIILMEGTPRDICSQTIQQQLANINGVLEVHDLHIWSLAPGKASATVHIVIDWKTQKNDPTFYESILAKCQSTICRHGVHHVTIQVDPDMHLGMHCRVDCCGSNENFLSSNTDPKL